MGARYTLFGADASYYTAKIHAYLRFKRIPFDDVLATRAVYREEILPRVGRPVVPVLVTPENETLQDTSEMIDVLEARHPTPPAVPESPVQRVVAYLLELYGDEWLKMPAMHYRWNHNYDFAVAEFGRINDPDIAPARQREIGATIGARFYAWLGPLGIDARTIPAIEASYLALLADLDTHFSALPYLMGDRPSLADFAFYGPFYAHLYRDPASGEILRRRAPRVTAWIERLRGGEGHTGNLLGADAIPASLAPVIRRLSDEYVPILVAQTIRFQAWLAESPAADIPDHFGSLGFTLGRGTAHEASGERAMFSYDQWMLQRVLDAYEPLAEADRRTVESFLARVGAADLLGLRIEQRVGRRDFKLIRE